MQTKTTLAALVAASFLGIGAAQAQVSTVITVAPPAPMVETVPGPRHGHLWAAGHYDWRHGRYVWVPGHWVAERRGYEWREARWIQRPNGSWVMVGGNWERRMGRDRDHDGVANRYDRDRDGDGVPNHRDRYPNNPNRS